MGSFFNEKARNNRIRSLIRPACISPPDPVRLKTIYRNEAGEIFAGFFFSR